jgi:hypothetical protein
LVAEIMSRGTILPSLPPLADDCVVAVCAACKFRFCLLERKRCAARKNGDPGQLEFTVAELRASGSQEHHSYWSAQPGEDSDMPKSIEDVKELTEHQRNSAINKPENGWTLEERASLHAGYLTEQLGLDPEQCRDAIREVWPEAAEAIDKYMLGLHAEKMEKPFMGGATR